MNKKSLILAISLMVIFVFTMGTTIAFLQDSDNAVTNTFVAGDIGDVDLSEPETSDFDSDVSNNDYLVVPGVDIAKNPVVSFTNTGAENLVDAYVFVTLEADGWTTTDNYSFTKAIGSVDDGLSCSVIQSTTGDSAAWTYVGKTAAGKYVYYVKVAKTSSLTSQAVLAPIADSATDNATVAVSDAITKADFEAAVENGTIVIDGSDLVFQAFAIQQNSFATAKDAFNAISTSDTIQ